MSASLSSHTEDKVKAEREALGPPKKSIPKIRGTL